MVVASIYIILSGDADVYKLLLNVFRTMAHVAFRAQRNTRRTLGDGCYVLVK
jgi:hypothetical protein